MADLEHIDARIIATDGKFRLVRLERGERVDHVLERLDGTDALGCERWKECNIGTSGETVSRQLRDWIIAHALTCKQMKESAL